MPCFACFFVPYSTFDNILYKLGIIVVGVALLKIHFKANCVKYLSGRIITVVNLMWCQQCFGQKCSVRYVSGKSEVQTSNYF